MISWEFVTMVARGGYTAFSTSVADYFSSSDYVNFPGTGPSTHSESTGSSTSWDFSGQTQGGTNFIGDGFTAAGSATDGSSSYENGQTIQSFSDYVSSLNSSYANENGSTSSGGSTVTYGYGIMTTYTSSTNTVATNYETTTTSTFPYDIYGSISTTSSYINITNTDFTTTSTEIIITTGTANISLNSFAGAVYLPEPGEILWYVTTYAAGAFLVSEMQSATDQITLFGTLSSAAIVGVGISTDTISIGTAMGTRVTNGSLESYQTISVSSGTTTRQISDFTHGGFITESFTLYSTESDTSTTVIYTTFTVTAVSFISSSTQLPYNIISYETPTAFAVPITYAEVLEDTVGITSTASFSFGPIVPGLNTVSNYSFAFSTSAGSSTVSASSSASTSYSSYTAGTDIFDGESLTQGDNGSTFDIGYDSTVFFGFGPNILGTYSAVTGTGGIGTYSLAPLALLGQPQPGMRTAPNANLVDQIHIGTNVFAPDDGSYVDEVGVQTSPVAYPFTVKTWKNTGTSSTVIPTSYSASWSGSSISLSTASSVNSTSITSGSQVTNWSEGSPLTGTYFKEITSLFDNNLFIGSGSYFNVTQANQILLPAGGWGRSETTEVVASFSTIALNSADFVRPIAAVSIIPNSSPVLIEVRSKYNQ